MRASSRRLSGVAIFSGIINLLTLSGSLYMLQVYDRVIPSRNVATLVGLSVIVLLVYLLQGYFDALRGRMLTRIGTLFDIALQGQIHRTLATLPLVGCKPQHLQQPLRDLDQIRAFLSGMGPTAFLDMPWTPIFFIALFVFHPVIGIVALLGGVAIAAVTLLAEARSRTAAKSMTDGGVHRQLLADAVRQNAEVIRALGMTDRFAARWSRANEASLQDNVRAMDVYANLGSIAKVLRYTLQSAILGAGAYLVINEQASGGIMIASSIMMGRALAPIEVALANWRQLVAARQGVTRLRDVLKATASAQSPAVTLPRPRHELSVEGLTVQAPGTNKVIVSNASFRLTAGAGAALIGASAAGKSSLVKALVGVWPAAAGVVRLDGSALHQWDSDELGRHLGYLPQDVSLIDGTVAENIARFDPNATSEGILTASRLAGAHDMIARLPDGYSTHVGERGASLSAGQRQRIGLARAVYGDPFLVVLDEPNANLDTQGETALIDAIEALRRRQCIVVVVSHRPNVLAVLDTVMVMHGGVLAAVGPRDEIFANVDGLNEHLKRAPGFVRTRPPVFAGALSQ